MRTLVAMVTGLLALVVLAGCGSDEPEIIRGDGADADAGDMTIRDARFTPLSGRTDVDVPAGANIVLSLYAVNNGDATDRLLAVTSPIAVGSDKSGSIEIPAGGTLASGAVIVERDSVPELLMLTELREPIRVGRTYPVTFLFEQGGAVTVPMAIGEPDRFASDPTYTPPTN